MNYINKIMQNRIAKSILLLAGGTASAQLINILSSPIITRIYSPEAYGISTIFASALAMLGIIGSLKFENAIAIADDDEKAINVVALSVIVLIFFVGIVTLIITIWGEVLLGLFSSTKMIKYKFLIPIGIFFMGIYIIFTQWTLRKKDYKVLSKTKLSQSLFGNTLKICFGILSFGPIGLILGNIIGQSAGIKTLSAKLIKNEKSLFRKISLKKIYWCGKRYVKFPIYSATSQFLNKAGLELPVIFLGSLYGSVVIGYYGLASVIVNLPMNLIARSVSDVFYSEAASIGRTNPVRLKNLSIALFKKLILIGLFPLLILLIFGPFLFSLVFGQTWYEAGVYSRILAFLIFTRFIFTPVSRVFSIFERQKEEFLLDLFRLVLVLIVFMIANIFSINSYWAVGLYTIAMSIIYLLTFFCANKIINSEITKKLGGL